MFRRGDDERHEPIHQREVGMTNTAGAGSGGAGSEVTVVGQGARLEGTLISAGSLRIDGQVKGKITAEGDVSLSPQSRVDADIDATNVTVAGAFKGNIHARQRAELAKGGKVEGDVTSKTLVIAEGAIFSGQSIMGEPSTRAGGPAAASSGSEPASDGERASESEKARA
jgi:cytoskeletal protein CcmA (bactofilin family)